MIGTPGVKSLKLGSNLGLQDILHLLRAAVVRTLGAPHF
jgi:hypothetical protein